MLPVDAKNCKICGSRKTKHESGICSVCRRRKKARPCIRCGERETVDESGLCSQCRLHLGRKLSGARSLDQAIARGITDSYDFANAEERVILQRDCESSRAAAIYNLYAGVQGDVL